MSVILAKLMSLPIRNFVIHTPTSLFKRYLTTTIVTVGKKNGVEPWISAGCSEYEKRINSVIDLETIFLKSDDALLDYIPSLRGTIIALDENGKEFTSREFSSYFYKALENGGAHVSLIIGGFSGLPSEIRNKYPLISIGKMTWTHQMARLLLLEQIYRAIEIRKGSSYHKD
eukprot:gene10404-21694_t